MEHKVHVVHRNLCEKVDNYTVWDDIKLPDMSPDSVTFCATFMAQIFSFSHNHVMNHARWVD